MRTIVPIALVSIALLLLPVVVPSTFVVHSCIMILWYAYIATAWNIIGGFAGQLSLGHSAFLAIGGYTSTLLYIHLRLTPWLGMLVGGAAAAIIAVLIGIPSFRLRGAYYSLATLAFADGLLIILETVKNLGPINLGAAEGISVPLVAHPTFLDFQWVTKGHYYYVILALLAVALLVSWLVERTKLGFYLTALRQDEEAAKALGINTRNVKLVAAGLSAFFTGIGGTFFAQLIRYLEPPTIAGLDLSTQMVFLSIVGGLGTVFGPFVGAITLTSIAMLSQTYFSATIPGLQLIIYGTAVMLVVLMMPRGQGVVHLIARLPQLVRRQIGHGPNGAADSARGVSLDVTPAGENLP